MDITTTEILIIDDGNDGNNNNNSNLVLSLSNSKDKEIISTAMVNFGNEILLFLYDYGLCNDVIKINSNKYDDLFKIIKTIMIPSAIKVLFSSSLKKRENNNDGNDDEQDIDDAIRTVFALMFKIIDKKDHCIIVPELCNSILSEQKKISNENDLNQIQARVIDTLSNLYTCLPVDSSSRYDAFITLVKYATITNQTNVLGVGPDDHEKIFQTFSQWNGTNNLQYQELLLALSAAMKNKSESNKFLICFLKSFKSGDEIGENVLVEARKIVLTAIKNPLFLSIENADLLRLEPIKRMAESTKNEKDVKLIQLLSIFSTETIGAYEKFEKENLGFIQELGLDPKVCTENMKLLTLVSLASEQDKISYSQVASHLKIDNGRQVEQWIVKAISLKLIDAKIDQVNETIIISKAIQRVFTDDQWKVLEKSINQWKVGIKDLLQTLQSSRESYHNKKNDRHRGDKRKENNNNSGKQ